MVSSELTSTIEDYLKVIWAGNEWNDDDITIGALATTLGLAPSSVSETIKRLTAQKLVEHKPYGGIRLTTDGERAAVRIVRRHRILETYLVRFFGYSWDEVHDEAENLEHGASERLIDAMDAALSYPDVDPHGDPIPRADGSLPNAALNDKRRTLADLDTGVDAVVVRVSDAVPELLRYCDREGLTLGAHVQVVERICSAQLMRAEVSGREVTLSSAAAAAVWVRPEKEQA
ncbi:MAG: metal-dependent transcriptional regulator [Bowdeniella nasicola]|nr:metal-dependent transcriptional regulator [Bowdeniella nasicola]